jgi:iron complex outermembrane receptor protein
MFLGRSLSLLIILALSAPQLLAFGRIEGQTKDPEGQTLPSAKVRLIELRRATTGDIDGKFVFDNVPAGTYQIKVQLEDFLPQLEVVTVKEGETTKVNITFDISIHDDLVVSASPGIKQISDVSQGVTVLGLEELQAVMEPTLGETLSGEAGVSSTYFGPGSSRPIIRGLGGDRIRVLESGLGNGDVSVVSVDHAISTDITTAQRVEILRGPASLRFGTAAVGGLINVIDDRIPEFLPDQPLTGQLNLGADTGADERMVGLNLNGAQGRFAYHVDYSKRDTDDLEIPGFAETEALRLEEGEEAEGEQEGILENSGIDTQKMVVGASYITDRGFIGVSFTDFETFYGIPGHAHGHGGHDDDHEDDHHDKRRFNEEDEHGHEDEEEFVNVDMEQQRFDVHGALNFDSDVLREIGFRFASTDYEHFELEGPEIGTSFANDFQELRLEATLGEWGPFTRGFVGASYEKREFEAIGAEAFIAPNDMTKYGAFIYQEIERDTWSFNVGLRFENQENDGSVTEHHHEDDHGHDDDHGDDDHGDDDHGDDDHGDDDHGDDDHGDDDHGDDDHGDDDHGDEHDDDHHDDEHEEEVETLFFNPDFDGFSASLGFVAFRDRPIKVATSATFTERAPTPEELFANGPHLATSAFEIGNPNLDTETSLAFDVSFRKTQGRVTGELNVFHNQFSDFVYEQQTGDIEDGLDVFQFLQGDATFYGAEFHADVELLHTDPHHLNLEFNYDMVRGDLDDGGNLPRITPDRAGLELIYKNPTYWGSIEVAHTAEQDRIADFETVTEDFTFLNFKAGYRFFLGKTVNSLLFRAKNLTDEEGRVHASFIKDRVLLPGRNFSLSYQLRF